MESGNVVFGPFITKDAVLRHYSVVLGVFKQREVEYAVLVYTTSKVENGPKIYGELFSEEDRRQANWPHACEFDGSRTCLVPVNQLRVTGKVSNKTLTKIEGYVLKAKARRMLDIEKQ